jgi:GT2 family glycosyltransferase
MIVETRESLPLVSIIVLNWKASHLADMCLGSLFTQEYPNIEVLYVDNASHDDSVAYVRSRFPKAVIVENENNLGYAGGNNAGIRVARGKYVVLLNQDTEAHPRFISEMVRVAEADPAIGMCNPKMLHHHDRTLINSLGMYLTRDRLQVAHLGDQEIDRGQYDLPGEFLAPSGAAGFYRVEMLDQIGLLDEDLFLYWEDMDIGWRGVLAGWKTAYVPESLLYHIRNEGTRRDGDVALRAQYLVHRNRWLVLYKNLAFGSLIRYGLRSLPGDLHTVARSLKAFVRERRRPMELLGRLAALRMLPRYWHKRRQVQRTRKIDEREVLRWIR